MTDITTIKRSWFYQLIRVLAILGLLTLGVIMVDLVLHPNAPDVGSGTVFVRLMNGFIAVPVIVLTGLLILHRAQGNLIGWLLMLLALIVGLGTVRAGILGGKEYLLNLLGFTWPAIWSIPIFFPDGRGYPRWVERLVQLLVVVLMCRLLLDSFSNPLRAHATFLTPETANPLYILPIPISVRTALDVGFVLCLVPFYSLMPISIITRYRGANAHERQQIKYMVWTEVLLIFMLLIQLPTGIMGLDPANRNGIEQFFYAIFTLTIWLLPTLAIGIAILRQHLYDIDIIIRRTLIYAVLTTILAAVYFGTVVLAQQIFRAITGQSSDLAIVVSTLAIAALFTPLRRRIQDVIDRRLYRRKYDAEQALAAFNATLRNDVDLDQLCASLIGVVQETMLPTHVSLWLKEPGRPRTGEDAS